MIPSSVAVLLVCLQALQVSGSLAPGDQAPSAPTEPVAKVWIGRYHEVEEYLRTAECVRIEDIGRNASSRRCVLPPGGPVSRMAWKVLPPGLHRGFRGSYKYEIAAYELDKLLQMDMVPPAVERELHGVTGAAILWVENASSWQPGTSPAESERTHWDEQVVRMRMFDALIGNKDRSLANALHDAAWNLILIDHTRTFGSDTELPDKLTGIDTEFWSRLERLTRPELDGALQPWLEEREIDAMLSRLERMRAEVRSLRKEQWRP